MNVKVICVLAALTLLLSTSLSKPIKKGGDVKGYLRRYGFLKNKNPSDEEFKNGIKKFQEYFNQNVTGDEDENLLSFISKPRCGDRDIPEDSDKRAMGGLMAWTKNNLTYKIKNYPQNKINLRRKRVKKIMDRSFQVWEDATDNVLKITKGRKTDVSTDIEISFNSGDHSNSYPKDFNDFDGPRGVLAHTYFPEIGWIHFDNDDTFSYRNSTGIDLETVMVHQVGHSLGLGHSDSMENVMYPFYIYNKTVLRADDIADVRAQYN